MKKIGLISDTHDYLDDAVFRHFDSCDEIWHAGDFGTLAIADALAAFKPLRGVYGNIDAQNIRGLYPESLIWYCEEVKVTMLHIGGYPPKYNPAARLLLQEQRPRLFISGHSHILKVMYDDRINCLHINPGAAGKHGWHKVRTLVRLVVDGDQLSNCEVIELGKR